MRKTQVSIFILLFLFVIDFSHSQSHSNYELVFEQDIAVSEKLFLEKEIEKFALKLANLLGKKKRTTTRVFFKPDLPANRFQEWGVGFFVPSENAIYLSMKKYEDRNNFYIVLRHEIIHSWINDMHYGRNFWPLWFEEGLAQLYSGKEITFTDAQFLSSALARKNILPQDSLLSIGDKSRYNIELFYLQSFFIVNLMQSNQMLNEYVKGDFWSPQGGNPPGFKDWLDFEIWWQTELEERYKWYLILNFDTTMAILFVILFLSVYIIKSLKNRQKFIEMTAMDKISNSEED